MSIDSKPVPEKFAVNGPSDRRTFKWFAGISDPEWESRHTTVFPASVQVTLDATSLTSLLISP